MLYVRRADDEHNYLICIRLLDNPDHNRRDRSHLYDCKQFGWYSVRKYCCSLVHISLRRKLKRSPRKKKINMFTTSQFFGVFFWSFVRFNCSLTKIFDRNAFWQMFYFYIKTQNMFITLITVVLLPTWQTSLVTRTIDGVTARTSTATCVGTTKSKISIRAFWKNETLSIYLSI